MTDSRFDQQLLRFRATLNVVGWVSFALISADYARFIDLPTVVVIPLWCGVLFNLFRWALWEGMIKPRLPAATDRSAISDSSNPRQHD